MGIEKEEKFFGLKLFRTLSRREVTAEPVSKDRHIIPRHLSREFKHLLGSQANTKLVTELHLQKSGTVREFFWFLTE